MPELRQSATNTVANDATSTCYVTLDQPSQAGSLLVVIATLVHEGYPVMLGPSGFQLAGYKTEDRLTVAVWYLAGAPSLSTIGVYTNTDDTLQVRVLEYTGAAQSAALDRVSIRSGDSRSPTTGATSTTTQADEVIVAAIANRWPSTAQSGFVSAGMARVGSDSVSASSWGPGGRNKINDDRRSRLSVHQAIQTSTAAWSLSGQLSTDRDWVAVIATFKGGTTGPARMTSTQAAPLMSFGGSGALTVFGPLRSTQAPALMSFGGSGRIGPFEMQMRIGGWDGLLIGPETPYVIEGVEGLGGWDVRVSDSDLSRSVGAQRGVDLQSARQVRIVTSIYDPQPAVMEAQQQALRWALVPRPNEDFDLLFRSIGGPLQILRCRPILVPGQIDVLYTKFRKQEFTLRAADPRVYSARERELVVPVTPVGATAPAAVLGQNDGNERAYPVITFENRDSVPVTGLQLMNATGAIAFEASITIAPGSVLIGDMPARVTQSGESVITLDGQPKYGSWQAPRRPFYLAPAPVAPGGANALYLRTTPVGAAVVCTLTYRDTWAG